MVIGYFLRRAAAYFFDYIAIFIYAASLAGLVIVSGVEGPSTKLGGYVLGLLTLTGPVVLVFALAETVWGRSPGKWALRLRVRRAEGQLGFDRALMRNLIKFLPWEIAHIGIWLTPGQPFVDPPSPTSLTLMVAAMACIVAQACLVLCFRTGLHDWMSGLRVVRA